MFDTSFFLVLFLGLGLFYLLVGLWSWKTDKDSDDFFLAGRSLSLWPLTLTLLATQIGGGALMGTVDKSFQIGLYGIAYNLGMCLGFLLLGLGFASKLRSFEVGTVAELFETIYDSPFLKKVASLISALSLFGLAAGQVVAIKLMLGGVGLFSPWILFVFWSFVILYTMLGGLRAVVIVDMVQVAVIILAFVGVYYLSMSDLARAFDSSSLMKLFVFNRDTTLFNPAHLSISSLFLMPMMFSLIEQDLAQRFFAAKSKKMAVVSCFLAAIIIFLFSFIPVHFGIKAKVLGLTILPGQSVLIATLAQFLPPMLLAMVVCAIGSAIISSADSLMCAVSSNICLDFNIKGRRGSTLTTMLVGYAVLFVGLFFDDILVVLLKSYELTVCSLFAPLFAIFFWKPKGALAAYFSVFVGAVSFFIFHFIEIDLPIPSDLFSVGLSFLALFVGAFLERK